MHRRIERLISCYSKFLAGGASLSMIIIFLIVFMNSVRRYSIGKSFEWGEQLPVFIAIYGVLFGAAWAYLQDRHIRFTMLLGFLSDSLTRQLYQLVDFIMIITGGVLTWSGYLFVLKRGGLEASGLINIAKTLSESTGYKSLIWIGHFYPYQAAMIVGGILLTMAAGLKLMQRITPTGAQQPEEV